MKLHSSLILPAVAIALGWLTIVMVAGGKKDHPATEKFNDLKPLGSSEILEQVSHETYSPYLQAKAVEVGDNRSNPDLGLVMFQNTPAVILPSPELDEFIQVDPAVVGNSVTTCDELVEVHSYFPTPQGSALSVVISPKETAIEPSVSSPIDQSVSAPSPRGFTYEEELFRTKWGWAAFAQVQREVRFPSASP